MKLIASGTITILCCGLIDFCVAWKYGARHSRMARAVKLQSAVEIDAGEWSNFLCVTSGSVEDIVPYASELRRGVDAVEIRVDMLRDKSMRSVAAQVAAVRELFQLPIIYTLRSKNHLGTFPNEGERDIRQLISIGLDCNVEWLDLEADLPESVIAAVLDMSKASGGVSRIIGSFHTAAVPQEAELEDMFRRCSLGGRADMLKLVTGADSVADCERIHEVGRRQSKPYIGVCLGEAGAHARVLNRRFTPVTHPRLSPAAPGQLSAEELARRRVECGLIAPKKYFLFGSPIQHSLSPSMHNGAFDALLMPHTYSLSENTGVGAYPAIMSSPDFGGASVTIPHKESIVQLCDEVRGAAKHIGAVNTVVVETDGPADGLNVRRRRVVGYNTDWLGILRPIARLLRGRTTVQLGGAMQSIGLVIGAGGAARAACYAVKDLGLHLVVANIDTGKAKLLAERFGGVECDWSNLGSIDPEMLKVIVSTVPAEANFSVPSALLQNRPVVLDAVYKPARTRLLTQAMEAGCPVVQGATMLLEQGVEQFELWHRRRAPRDAMERAVFRGVEQLLKPERQRYHNAI